MNSFESERNTLKKDSMKQNENKTKHFGTKLIRTIINEIVSKSTNGGAKNEANFGDRERGRAENPKTKLEAFPNPTFLPSASSEGLKGAHCVDAARGVLADHGSELGTRGLR